MVFYELYLKDSDGSFVDIPVKIVNLKDSKTFLHYSFWNKFCLESGNFPNTNEELSTTEFTRRFFIFDTISGITKENGYSTGATPTIMRYAKTMRLITSVQEKDSTRINRPYLVIEYRSREVANLDVNPTSSASFQVKFAF